MGQRLEVSVVAKRAPMPVLRAASRRRGVTLDLTPRMRTWRLPPHFLSTPMGACTTPTSTACSPNTQRLRVSPCAELTHHRTLSFAAARNLPASLFQSATGALPSITASNKVAVCAESGRVAVLLRPPAVALYPPPLSVAEKEAAAAAWVPNQTLRLGEWQPDAAAWGHAGDVLAVAAGTTLFVFVRRAPRWNSHHDTNDTRELSLVAKVELLYTACGICVLPPSRPLASSTQPQPPLHVDDIERGGGGSGSDGGGGGSAPGRNRDDSADDVVVVVGGPPGVEVYRVAAKEETRSKGEGGGARSRSSEARSQSSVDEGDVGRDTSQSSFDITLVMRVADLIGVFACAVAVATTTCHAHTLATAARSGLVYFTPLERVRAPQHSTLTSTDPRLDSAHGAVGVTASMATDVHEGSRGGGGASGGGEDGHDWRAGENIVVELAPWRRKDVRVTAIAFANGCDSLAAACTWAGEVFVMRRRGSSSWRAVCTVDPAADASMHSWLCWTVRC